MNIKYKPDIHLIFKVESVACFLPVFISFYEDYNKECPLTEFEEFTSF